MIKTQVQIPDHLYKDAKRIARDYEMSFAEVVRRGLEKMGPAYPVKRAGDKKWSPPKPRALGWKGLSKEGLKEAAQMTALEEELSSKGRR